MIASSVAAFVLEEDSQQQFLGARIMCEPTYLELQQKFAVKLNVLDSVSSTVIYNGYMEVTSTEVDAETGSGSGETAPWWNALQKAVVTKLEDIPDNSGVTFAII